MRKEDMSASTDSTTTVIHVQIGYWDKRDWIWEKDEEIIITSKTPISESKAKAIAAVMFGADRYQLDGIEIV